MGLRVTHHIRYRLAQHPSAHRVELRALAMAPALDIGTRVGDHTLNTGSLECGTSCGKLSIDSHVGHVTDQFSHLRQSTARQSVQFGRLGTRSVRVGANEAFRQLSLHGHNRERLAEQVVDIRGDLFAFLQTCQDVLLCLTSQLPPAGRPLQDPHHRH